MNLRICPESAAALILSTASIHCSGVAVSGSMPMLFSVIGTVSRISVSIVTWPLYFGSKRSEIESMSGASSLWTMIPVIPACQGTVKSRSGSADGWRRAGIRFFSTFGTALGSSRCR